MFSLFRRAKPTVKQVYAAVRLDSKDIPEKKVRRDLKKTLPYISKEEIDTCINRLRHEGGIGLRLSKKEAKSFKVLLVEIIGALIPPEDYECCGGEVCGALCARDVTESEFYSETNLGIITESD